MAKKKVLCNSNNGYAYVVGEHIDYTKHFRAILKELGKEARNWCGTVKCENFSNKLIISNTYDPDTTITILLAMGYNSEATSAIQAKWLWARDAYLEELKNQEENEKMVLTY